MAHSGSRQMEEHGLPEIHPVTSAVEGGTSSGKASKALVMVSNISQYGQFVGRKFGGRHRLTAMPKGAPLGENKARARGAR